MRQGDLDRYLKKNPGVMKWINECPGCHRKGYRPDMPEHIGGENSMAADNIRKMLHPMDVDDLGFCVVCSKIRKRYYVQQ